MKSQYHNRYAPLMAMESVSPLGDVLKSRLCVVNADDASLY